MKRLACVLALASVAIPMTATQADVIERVVATVNDEAIFLSQLRRRAVPFLERIMAEPAESTRMEALRQLYGELLERLIDEELFKQAASRMQVRVTSADVRRAVQNVMRQNGLSEDEFWEAVRGQGFSEAQYRSDLRRQLLRLKVLNQRVRSRVNITETDVRRVYDQRLRRANRSLRFRTSQVFVAVTSGSATAVREAREEATAIHEGLTADNFDEAVEQYGGGSLGWLSQGDLPAELENALMTLDEGEVSEPVRGARGFHIFLLQERQRGVHPRIVLRFPV